MNFGFDKAIDGLVFLIFWLIMTILTLVVCFLVYVMNHDTWSHEIFSISIFVIMILALRRWLKNQLSP